MVGVYDGGAASIYYDGKLIHSAGISGMAGWIMANQVAGFGMQPGLPDAVPPVAPSDFFDGTVDDTAIWNRALSTAEISYLYNGE